MQINSFCLRQSFFWWFQRMTRCLYLFCCLFGSKLRLMLESMQVLFQSGFSECFSCFAFWVFRFAAALSFIRQQHWKVRRRIPIDAANRFFCSVISWVHCRDWCWGRCRLYIRLIFHDALLAIDSLAGLVTYLTVLFYFYDFFSESDLLKSRKLSCVLGHWFGHSPASDDNELGLIPYAM